jgi:Ca2+:H+ antiporter
VARLATRGSREDYAAAALRNDWFLSVSWATGLILLFWGEDLYARFTNPLWLWLTFSWLFAVVLVAALSVLRHADQLAHRLGEPYGTLILTFAVTSIEVISITAVTVHGDNPAMARDTLFSVVMIILNGMVGLSLLIGGWRHQEQYYNLQGANVYLGVIISLMVLSFILPNYTQTTPGPTLSLAQEAFLALMSLCLYGAFLAIQTSRHRSYFASDGKPEAIPPADALRRAPPPAYHTVMLTAHMVPLVFLAEQLAHPLNYFIDRLHAPEKLAGMAVALMVATPEAIGAVRAAIGNHLQRSMNIFLGSVLSTVGLTVPAVLAISYAMGRSAVLGLQNTDAVLMLLTLAVSVVTFASGRTNVLHGLVHLILFAAYIFLIFEK